MAAKGKKIKKNGSPGFNKKNSESFLNKNLANQVDRWLDSVWVITWWKIYTTIKNGLKGYRKYIRHLWQEPDSLSILHHRKATIWDITLDNSHPFIWKHFNLMQNWTSKKFYKMYDDIYKWETDSETLMNYIESRTKDIRKVPAVLDNLAEQMDETFWNIIITNGNLILFYADWARETYINIKGKKVESITNYLKWSF